MVRFEFVPHEMIVHSTIEGGYLPFVGLEAEGIIFFDVGVFLVKSTDTLVDLIQFLCFFHFWNMLSGQRDRIAN